MIVQCQECSTKFRLDDSKVGAAGVKVRCAKCRHIFVVHRESPAEEPDVDSMLQGLGEETSVPAPEPSAVPQPAGPSIEMDDDLLRTLAGTAEGESVDDTPAPAFDTPFDQPPAGAGGGQEFELDIPLPDWAAAEPSPPADFVPPSFQEFSFDLPKESAGGGPEDQGFGVAAEEGAFSLKDEEGFSFGEVPQSEESAVFASADLGFGAVPPSEEEADDGFSSTPFEPLAEPPVPAPAGDEWGGSLPPPALPVPAEEDFVFGEAAPKQVEKRDVTFSAGGEPEVEPSGAADEVGDFIFGAPTAKGHQAASPGSDTDLRALLSKGTAGVSTAEPGGPLVFGTPPFEGGEEEDYPPLSIASRKRGGTSSALRLLLVLLMLLAVAGGSGWWYVQQHGVASLEGVLAAVGVDMAPRFELQEVKGTYVTGSGGLELFVVQGEVRNLSRFARAEIQVRASLYGAGNRPLAKKSAFCGNPLPPAKLATLPIEEIENAMANRFGDGLSNLEVKQGAAIPFTVVFAAPPKDAVDFAVELAGSVLAQKKKE